MFKALVDRRGIRTGSAWSFSSKMGPLVHPPNVDLERGLKELEAGEPGLSCPNNSRIIHAYIRRG